MNNEIHADFIQDVLNQFQGRYNELFPMMTPILPPSLVNIGHVRSNVDKVTVANSLITAGYRLSLIEKRLLLLFVAKIDNRIEYDVKVDRDTGALQATVVSSMVDGKELNAQNYYSISVEEYAQVFNTTKESAKILLARSARELFENKLVFFSKDMQLHSNWISNMVVYHKDTNAVLIQWNEYILPFLQNLNKSFTTYKIAVLRKLHSTYSLRLYEVFLMEISRRRMNCCDVYISLEDLHFMLQFPQGKIPKIGSLMHDIIKPAVEEINAQTDIVISLEREGMVGRTKQNVLGYTKRGKKVIGIMFNIRKRSKAELDKIASEEQLILYNLQREHDKQKKIQRGGLYVAPKLEYIMPEGIETNYCDASDIIEIL